MHIKDIGQVISGYAFRGAIQQNNNGNVAVFQAKDVIQGEPFEDVNSLIKISAEISFNADYLRKNDVLLLARGIKQGSFRSTIFTSDEPNIIASASVYIIRPDMSRIVPAYLSYYLNSSVGQKALLGIVSGSYIPAVPRQGLELIDIPILSLEKQKMIVHLYQNIRVQQELLERELFIKQHIINSVFRKVATV